MEDAAVHLYLVPQLAGVHEVAVVRDGEIAFVVRYDDGLRVFDVRVARRGVAHVADGGVAPHGA